MEKTYGFKPVLHAANVINEFLSFKQKSGMVKRIFEILKNPIITKGVFPVYPSPFGEVIEYSQCQVNYLEFFLSVPRDLEDHTHRFLIVISIILLNNLTSLPFPAAKSSNFFLCMKEEIFSHLLETPTL